MSTRISLIILAITGLLLYLPSLFGPFLWDDEDFVYANKYVENFQIDKFFTDSQTAGRGKLSNYYRPIPQIVYAITHSLFDLPAGRQGFNPFWYHLVNVLAHITASIAIFLFFKILLEKIPAMPNFARAAGYPASWRGGSASTENFGRAGILPLFIALFFLVHPVQTESISYISGLSDPLFVLFGFLSLIFSLKNKLAASLLFFLLSILSKETGMVFLFLLFLLNYKKIIPYLFIAITYLWYHLTAINSLDMKAAWGVSPYGSSAVVRLLTFIQSLPVYLGLLVYPKDLFMERDYTAAIQTQILNPYLFGFILVNALIIYFLVRWRSWPLIFFFLSFYLCFAPYTGVVLINGIFYEHYLYLPLVFFFAFLIFLLPKTRPMLLLLLLSLLLLSVRTIAREQDWTDAIRFYSQTLAHAPQSIRIRNGLAMAYADKGDLDSAIVQYLSAIKQNPNVPNLYHNLANAYAAKGDIKSAEENYQKAIAVDPHFFFSWQSLANLYQQTGQKEKLQKLVNKYNELTNPPK